MNDYDYMPNLDASIAKATSNYRRWCRQGFWQGFFMNILGIRTGLPILPSTAAIRDAFADPVSEKEDAEARIKFAGELARGVMQAQGELMEERHRLMRAGLYVWFLTSLTWLAAVALLATFGHELAAFAFLMSSYALYGAASCIYARKGQKIFMEASQAVPPEEYIPWRAGFRPA